MKRRKHDNDSNKENHIRNKISNKINNMTPIELYDALLVSRCERYIKKVQLNEKTKLPKLDREKLDFSEYDYLIHHKTNVQQLKSIAKRFKLKVSGNKNQLFMRIFVFMRLSSLVIKIQKCMRGCIQRLCNSLQGPALIKREICTNVDDFLTFEQLKDIDYKQFFSYKDKDNFVYGFDIVSLYNLIVKSGSKALNPYNRNPIPSYVVSNIKRYLKMSKTLEQSVAIVIPSDEKEEEIQDTIQMRTHQVFHQIDELGNYSQVEWFLSLRRSRLMTFIRELHDIWNYRAQITEETKRMICPPNGNPFINPNQLYSSLHQCENIESMYKIIVPIMEKLVSSGINTDNKTLGAYYVLGALTIVNENAALALPWLYQSFSYV